MTYTQWHNKFTAALLSPDMPLISFVQGRNLGRLLAAYHEQGFKPKRVATMFNRRFIKAMKDQDNASFT